MFPLLCNTAEEKTNPSSYEFGETWFDSNKDNMLKCIDLTCLASQSAVTKPVQMKLTAIIDAKICKILSDVILKGHTEELGSWLQSIAENRSKVVQEVSFLDAEQQKHAICAIRRLIDVFSNALKKQINVLVDAEYDDINPAINFISTNMMLLFNKNAPVVQCTYQCYLKSSYNSLRQDMEFCKHFNIHFGAKVVRGAYLESERIKAQKLNMESPVFETWQQTNKNYNKVIAKLIEEISKNKKCHVMVASHNKESIELSVDFINSLGIERSSPQILFAQLYGLSDHLSLWLAKNGFQVYKSSPIGSVDETIPYMIRRANENNSVIQNSRGDRTLMMQEILSRCLFF
uniref:Proline dehydrogenase n=1 Tax=Phallusia mammillata TaxID=59560 RepID=A0A6F9DP14_9ASCI|nr:probable proline dehydrogenase 2 [Phallusia mammillata]